MEITKIHIEGLIILQPKVFTDERGYFFESYNQKTLLQLGIDAEFVQDNESKSQKGVLRGMHFQKPPYTQGKLVRVVKGSVLDVAVDLRKNSQTYGQYATVLLSEQNKTQFWIPEGFAHGFLTLEDDTVFSYKCTNLYNKELEGTLRWDDEKLGIKWGIAQPVQSEKDKLSAVDFSNFVSPF